MSDGSHADFLAKLSEDHQAKLGDAIVNLEDKITDLMSGAPLTDGEFFDLEWAVESRNELRKIIDKEYLEEVDKIVKDYSGVAERATDMLQEYGDFTRLDKSVITQLQSLTFQGFESVGDQYLSAVSKEIYDMTLVGTSFSDAVKNVRATVSGNLKRYADQQVHDGLMQFNANANVAIGKQSGVTKWKYFGGLQDNSRSHCKKHAGKVYTEEEIAEIWSGNWAGKASGDPFVVRGGYRCQHHWRPVFDEEVVSDVVEEEPVDLDEAPEGVPKRQKRVDAEKEIKQKIKPKYQDVESGQIGDDYYSYPNVGGVAAVRFTRDSYNKRKHGDNWIEHSRNGFGNIEYEFSDDLSSVMVGMLDETAELSLKYKVPQIRGLDVTGSAVASMGDGVLSVNPRYLDKVASSVYVTPAKRKKALSKADDLEKQRAKQQEVVNKLRKEREELDELWVRMEITNAPEDEIRAISNKVFAASDEVSKARLELQKINGAIQEQRDIAGVKQVNNWKFGDDPSLRPHTAEKYFIDPLDDIRTTVYHEYGHTVHQEYNRRAFAFSGNEPDLEQVLKRLNRKRDKMQSTKYMAKNGKEWWAESFALHNLGRKDLVDPRMNALIEAIAESPVRLSQDELQAVVDKADKKMKAEAKKRKK
jgi:hypothetical protein